MVLAGEKGALTLPGSGADVTPGGAVRAWALVASAIWAAVGTGTVDDEAAPLGTMRRAGSKAIPAVAVITLTHPFVPVLRFTVSSFASGRSRPGIRV